MQREVSLDIVNENQEGRFMLLFDRWMTEAQHVC